MDMQYYLDEGIRMATISKAVSYTHLDVYKRQTMGIDSIKNVYKAQIDNGNTFFASNARGLPDGLRCLLQRAVRECCLKTDTDIEKLLEELLIMSRGVIYYWCIPVSYTHLDVYKRQRLQKYKVSSPSCGSFF